MALAGLGWLAFLSPNLAHSLTLAIEGLGISAEASLMLWLIVMGVNVLGWKEQASATGRPAVCRRCGAGAWPSRSGLIRMRLTQSLA